MASGDLVADKPKCDAMLVDKLPDEINEMKIKDEKVEKVGVCCGKLCGRFYLFRVYMCRL